MENISLVTWGSEFLLDKTLSREYSYYTNCINVHELVKK